MADAPFHVVERVGEVPPSIHEYDIHSFGNKQCAVRVTLDAFDETPSIETLVWSQAYLVNDGRADWDSIETVLADYQ